VARWMWECGDCYFDTAAAYLNEEAEARASDQPAGRLAKRFCSFFANSVSPKVFATLDPGQSHVE